MPERPDSPRLVMVVDDDARAARVLAQMLREDGYNVEVVLDGAAAIHRLSREPLPDVLVTDFRMPHADGMAVLSYARSRRPHIPVILVTSYPETVEAWSTRFDPPPRVFSKPLAYGEFVQELARLTQRNEDLKPSDGD